MKLISMFRKEGTIAVTVATIVSLFLVVSAVQATTTISTDITTGGALSVTGASTLTGLTTNVAGYVSQASSTLVGNLTVTRTFSPTHTSASTFTVSGLPSLGQASSTRLSVFDTAYFGGSATTTINSAGNVSVAGTLAVTGASTLAGATFSGLASSTTLKVGNDSVSTVSGLIFGFCTASITATASTSAYADCSGATGVTSSYKVFLQATSSLPSQIVLQAASSTVTTGTINIQVLNTGITGGNVSASVNSFNFWAVR